MPSYDDRNKADFDDLTRRLETALVTLASDDAMTPTVKALSTLAGCSHATLYLRRWPIERLWVLRQERKERQLRTRRRRRMSYEDKSRFDLQVDEKQVLEERLRKAEEETIKWVECFLGAAAEIRKQDKLVRDLRQRKTHLEGENKKLRGLIQEIEHRLVERNEGNNVVALRPRNTPKR